MAFDLERDPDKAPTDQLRQSDVPPGGPGADPRARRAGLVGCRRRNWLLDRRLSPDLDRWIVDHDPRPRQARAHVGQGELGYPPMDEAKEIGRDLRREQTVECRLHLAVDDLGLPECLDDLVLKPRFGQQRKGLARAGVRLGNAHDPEELLFDGHHGVAVVDPPFVAVREGDPLDAGDGGVVQDLAGPLVIVEVDAERLGFNEQARLPKEGISRSRPGCPSRGACTRA